MAVALAVAPGPLNAWWESGHLTVAAIARNHLRPAALGQVNGILAFPLEGEPMVDPFLLASVWPDLVKDKGLKALDSWHFLNRPEGSSHPIAPTLAEYLRGGESMQIVKVVEQCLQTLKSAQAGRWEKAFMMRWLIHLVADVHQPLHCITRVSSAFPTGDLGGIRFTLPLQDLPNLHFLWDSSLGIVPDLRYAQLGKPEHGEFVRKWEAAVQELERSVPRTSLKQLGHGTAQDWAEESFQLARGVAYQGVTPGQAPSQAYLAKAKLIAAQQLVLAGYRLADLLNELYPDPNGSGAGASAFARR